MKFILFVFLLGNGAPPPERIGEYDTPEKCLLIAKAIRAEIANPALQVVCISQEINKGS